MSDTDTYGIDSHKLHLHPRRVADWLEGGNIAPLYVEISPSGACNHRCCFCGLDFMGYKPRFLPTDVLCWRLEEMGQAGVKAVMYAGEGEPFLHRDMAHIARATKAAGIDVAFTTNAVNLRPETAREVLPAASWIKVSCNAGTAETYARIHGAQAGDFARVMDNMAEATALRRELGSSCTLGFQMVLLPENQDEAVPLARAVRELGADYLVIKPYSHHPQSNTQKYAEVSYEHCSEISRVLEELNTDSFKSIFRQNALMRWQKRHKGYERCLAFPFWSYLDAGGTLWGCSVFLGDERFAYGNLMQNSFDEIWNGEQRRASLDWCASRLDATHCRINCRMDSINHYLWSLTHPHSHVNFI